MVEALGERWIQKCREMPVMIGVLHRCDARAGEDIGEHLLKLLELRCHLLEQYIVMLRAVRAAVADDHRRVVDLPREVQDEPLTAQPTIEHRLPVARETLVSTAARPDVRRAFGLLSVAQQLGAIVGITEPLHLKA